MSQGTSLLPYRRLGGWLKLPVREQAMKIMLLSISCLFLVSGCGPRSLPKPTQAEAAEIVDKTEAAFLTGDPVRIMEHYTQDAVFFDSEQDMPTRDRAVASKWTASLVAHKRRSFSRGQRVLQPLGEHVLISSGVAEIEIEGKEGPKKIKVRYTDVYQQQSDRMWLIVHEHLSKLPSAQASPDA